MNKPENIVKVTAVVLLLFGYGCTFFGHFFDHHLLAKIGRWVLVLAILLAFLPLACYSIMMMAEKVRCR
jgi:uncharacterized membrane protein